MDGRITDQPADWMHALTDANEGLAHKHAFFQLPGAHSEALLIMEPRKILEMTGLLSRPRVALRTAQEAYDTLTNGSLPSYKRVRVENMRQLLDAFPALVDILPCVLATKGAAAAEAKLRGIISVDPAIQELLDHEDPHWVFYVPTPSTEYPEEYGRIVAKPFFEWVQHTSSGASQAANGGGADNRHTFISVHLLIWCLTHSPDYVTRSNNGDLAMKTFWRTAPQRFRSILAMVMIHSVINQRVARPFMADRRHGLRAPEPFDFGMGLLDESGATVSLPFELEAFAIKFCTLFKGPLPYTKVTFPNAAFAGVCQQLTGSTDTALFVPGSSRALVRMAAWTRGEDGELATVFEIEAAASDQQRRVSFQLEEPAPRLNNRLIAGIKGDEDQQGIMLTPVTCNVATGRKALKWEKTGSPNGGGGAAGKGVNPRQGKGRSHTSASGGGTSRTFRADPSPIDLCTPPKGQLSDIGDYGGPFQKYTPFPAYDGGKFSGQYGGRYVGASDYNRDYDEGQFRMGGGSFMDMGSRFYSSEGGQGDMASRGGQFYTADRNSDHDGNGGNREQHFMGGSNGGMQFHGSSGSRGDQQYPRDHTFSRDNNSGHGERQSFMGRGNGDGQSHKGRGSIDDYPLDHNIFRDNSGRGNNGLRQSLMGRDSGDGQFYGGEGSCNIRALSAGTDRNSNGRGSNKGNGKGSFMGGGTVDGKRFQGDGANGQQYNMDRSKAERYAGNNSGGDQFQGGSRDRYTDRNAGANNGGGEFQGGSRDSNMGRNGIGINSNGSVAPDRSSDRLQSMLTRAFVPPPPPPPDSRGSLGSRPQGNFYNGRMQPNNSSFYGMSNTSFRGRGGSYDDNY